MLINKIKDKLRQLTNKKNVYLTRRGNTSIKDSLKFVKSIGFEDVFIQDQGGWLTYPQFIEKLKLNLYYLKTDYGLINSSFNNFENIDKLNKYVILFNTMPAYSYLQDINILREKLLKKDKEILFINDVAGSIGYEQTSFGDIIIGSFGEDKPINLQKGGFIATNYEMQIDEEPFTEEEQKILFDKLSNISKRMNFFEEKHKEIINEIKKNIPEAVIVNQEMNGINVIVKFDNNKTKQKITDFCHNNNYEYTECPRYIRINEPAISIEVKRLNDE